MSSAPPLASDLALPRRDVLLDETRMRSELEILALRGKADIEACRLVRANYQVGKSLRAVYRIAVHGVTHIVAARMFRTGKSIDASAMRRELDDVAGLRSVTHAQNLEAIFWVFPNDRRIDGLSTFSARGALNGCVPPNTTTRLVAYAAEKSATFVCEDDGAQPIAYAKVAAAHQAARDYRTYLRLQESLDAAARHHLRIPRPLAYDPAARTLWLEPIDGRRMSDAAEPADLDDLRRFGCAVATFHRLRPGDAPPLDRFDSSRLLRDSALIGLIRPDVSDRLKSLSARLARTTPPLSGVVCLHGDLHPKNAILCGASTALIDVEDVALGPAAADLGSYLAGLVYLREGHRLTWDSCANRMRAFLAGYESIRALPPPPSLAWHTAAALFVERASRAVTRVRPLGLDHLGELLDASERLLDRGVEA